jgi:hypothetical protein
MDSGTVSPWTIESTGSISNSNSRHSLVRSLPRCISICLGFFAVGQQILKFDLFFGVLRGTLLSFLLFSPPRRTELVLGLVPQCTSVAVRVRVRFH